MLCARPRSSLERWLALTIDELHRLLDARGYQFEFLCNQRLRWKRPAPVLKNIVQQYPANCWVLASQSAAVQHWFQKQRLNAILFGTPYPGIRFSSIDDDNRAICRHAAGIFLGLGHRQVVYFSRQIGGAGVLAGEDGFLEAFQSKVAGAASPLVIRHDGSVERLRAGFQKICRLRPRPTALLVSSAEDALTLFSLALHLGFRIPRDFSLISCGDDQLQRIVPTIACYQMEAEKNALLITRLIGAELISNSSPRHFRIFPKFWRGETLARPM
jgi:LacI family transcriptional regulator